MNQSHSEVYYAIINAGPGGTMEVETEDIGVMIVILQAALDEGFTISATPNTAAKLQRMREAEQN